jgi:RNA polymerase sigma-70 factor, ECF subfamily
METGMLLAALAAESADPRFIARPKGTNPSVGNAPEFGESPAHAKINCLIEAEISFLRRAARRWRRNSVDADDLLQETLVRALASTHLWEPGSNLRGWLLTIMRNEFFAALVRGGRWSAATDAGDILAVDPSMDAETRLTLRDVERSLKRLSAKQREAILLAGIEGKSYADVAGTMGISVDSVRCHLARARDQLRTDVYGADKIGPSRRSAGQGGPRHHKSLKSKH